MTDICHPSTLRPPSRVPMRLPAQAPARVILIRHGESEQNAVAGQAGTAGYLEVQRREPRTWGLTRQGERQAEACGRWLRGIVTGAAEVRCSPFLRAVATARALGVGRPILAEELAERNWGRWFEGASGEDYAVRAARARRLAAADPWGWCPDGGESLLDLRNRIGGYLWRLISGAGIAGTLMAVSHGEAILAARAFMEGLPLRHPLADLPGGRRMQALPNAGIIIYSRVGPAGEQEGGYRWRAVLTNPERESPSWPGVTWADVWDDSSTDGLGNDDSGAAGDR